MITEALKADILSLVAAHGPLKAKTIVALLKQQSWTDVYTSTINPLLYGDLRSQVIRSEAYEWSIHPARVSAVHAVGPTPDPVPDDALTGLSFGVAFFMSRKRFIWLFRVLELPLDWSRINPGIFKEVGMAVPESECGGYSLRVMNNCLWKALTDRRNTRLALPPDAVKKAEAGAQDAGIIGGGVPDAIPLLPGYQFFDTVKEIIQVSGLPPVHTRFSDRQAVELCARMASGWARALARRFGSAADPHPAQTRYEIHAIATKAHSIYGGQLLSFIATLPRLPFQNKTAVEVRSYKHVRPDFPLFSFQRTTEDQIHIGFFLRAAKTGSGAAKLVPDVRVLSAKHEAVGTVNKAGQLQLKIEAFRPLLSVFFAPEGPRYELYSGVTSGHCGVCNRALSHPDSLRMGIGPVCAQSCGFDGELYGGTVER